MDYGTFNLGFAKVCAKNWFIVTIYFTIYYCHLLFTITDVSFCYYPLMWRLIHRHTSVSWFEDCPSVWCLQVAWCTASIMFCEFFSEFAALIRRTVRWWFVGWLLLLLLLLADLHCGSRGGGVSPAKGAAAGGELPWADLHPFGNPEGLPGVALLRGGEPVWGQEAPGPGGLRQGECPPPPNSSQSGFLSLLLLTVSAGVVSSSVPGAFHRHQEEVYLRTILVPRRGARAGSGVVLMPRPTSFHFTSRMRTTRGSPRLTASKPVILTEHKNLI